MKLKYNTENMTISQESFNYEVTPKTESIMAQGNGYIGIRGVDEEFRASNNEDFFVNGFFNQADDMMVSELVNLADSVQTRMLFNGSYFKTKSSDKYVKTLDLNTGELIREIEIKKFENARFRLTFQRFVSQSSRHIYCQKIMVTQLSGKPVTLTIQPVISGATTNGGTQHMKEGVKKRVTPTSLQYKEVSNQKGHTAIHNMIVVAKNGGKKLKGGTDNFVITMARRKVGFNINEQLKIGEPFVMEKLMSVSTSVDDVVKGHQPVKHVKEHADALHEYLLKTTYAKEFALSKKEWKNIYERFDVKINGDSEDAKYDRLAIKYSIYHQNGYTPKYSPFLSVAAKGLSGEGYQGHTFWDTEFFINPNYLLNRPSVARNLLEYRYKGIEGARAKAMEVKVRKEESKIIGAQYPWEAAWPSDGEVCPYWGQADVVTGVQVPIASRRQEIHVSADVAFAVHQYFDFTNDKNFMDKMGLEMIIDTAIFWSNRAELQNSGKYMIKDVMGPNEYKGNIHNNAFINKMAKFNLDLALHYKDKWPSTKFEKAISKIPYKVNWKKIKHVSENLVQQLPNSEGVIAENDQFMKLTRNDVRSFQLLGDAGKKLFSTKAGHKLLGSQLVKQADVVLLTYLFPHEYSREVVRSNFEFYEPITTHDSSLSPTTYSIQAAELRKTKLAYDLYKYSINIDMGPNMHSCDAGIHSGANSAVYQSTVFGFGGLRWFDSNLHINPILPKAWEGLDYKVTYKGIRIEVKIKKEWFTIRTLDSNSLNIYVNNKKEKITNTISKFKVVTKW